jgi:hypothetical protein
MSVVCHARKLRTETVASTRLVPDKGQTPASCGDKLRFALFAAPSSNIHALAGKFTDRIDAVIRPPVAQDVIVLARPDGYKHRQGQWGRGYRGLSVRNLLWRKDGRLIERQKAGLDNASLALPTANTQLALLDAQLSAQVRGTL